MGGRPPVRRQRPTALHLRITSPARRRPSRDGDRRTPRAGARPRRERYRSARRCRQAGILGGVVFVVVVFLRRHRRLPDHLHLGVGQFAHGQSDAVVPKPEKRPPGREVLVASVDGDRGLPCRQPTTPPRGGLQRFPRCRKRLPVSKSQQRCGPAADEGRRAREEEAGFRSVLETKCNVRRYGGARYYSELLASIYLGRAPPVTIRTTSAPTIKSQSTNEA